MVEAPEWDSPWHRQEEPLHEPPWLSDLEMQLPQPQRVRQRPHRSWVRKGSQQNLPLGLNPHSGPSQTQIQR